jgi:hypothetical protein
MGVAVDDAHHITKTVKQASRPGKAWVEVFGDRTESGAICSALAKGQLYASSGPRLSLIEVSDEVYTVQLAEGQGKITFLGPRETVLGSFEIKAGEPVAYTIRGGEGYVRARITIPGIGTAWTPPVDVLEDHTTADASEIPEVPLSSSWSESEGGG